VSRARKEPLRDELSDLDWLRLLSGIGGRRLERQVTASLKVTTTVRRTHAAKIDALLLIAARGLQAVERIATCLERRQRARPRKTRKAAR
jgi:hypothetical protein